jgi:DUF1009 family protein
MSQHLCSLGLIAGNRSLPLEFARQAKATGVQRLIAVGFEGETEPALAELVDELVWIRVGQLSKMISAFTDRGISQCVMLGQIAPKSLFDVRLDMRGMGLLWRIKERNAHSIFGAIAQELKKDGVELIEPLPWLKPLMPAAGYRTGPAPTPDQEQDVAFGFGIAKEISRLEIGQSAVVKNGTVLAVEGLEGTDACLKRGGDLAGDKGGAVAVKVAKQNHDLRFDLPCIGAQTIEICASAGIAVFAFEANKTLMLDRSQIESLARQRKITVQSHVAAQVGS